MLLAATDNFPKSEVGNKARVLQTLQSSGYAVPKFVVLPVSSIKQTNVSIGDLIEKIPKFLCCAKYAVRSAALSEDEHQSAMAGQFLTKLAVPYAELAVAVQEIIDHAETVAGFVSGTLSIIIQEFIEPDYAGVLFTRNPLGGYEQVCEYVHGRGEHVVSGHASAQKRFYTLPTENDSDKLPFASELYTQAKSIEAQWETPQDIEWVYKNGSLYIVQSRAITTLSCADLDCAHRVEAAVPTEPFFYTHTSITETFARPTPLALSLLEFLYSQNGPIADTYQSLGITYTDTHMFQLVGNQLYVDKQAETKALFPAKGVLKYKTSTPRVEQLAGLLTTLKNSLKLSWIRTNPQAIDQQKLIDYLRQPPHEAYQPAKNQIKHIYQHIFRINVLSQLALGKMHAMAKDSKLVESLLAQTYPSQFIGFQKKDIVGELLGNSISIDDKTVFTAQDFPTEVVENPTVHHWKAKALLPKAIEVQNLMQLRELARWASVKVVSELRTAVQKIAQEQDLSDTYLIHFATLFEIENHLPPKEVLGERRRQYQTANECTFLNQLTNFPLPTVTQDTSLLSPGSAVGILCTKDTLTAFSKPKILLVHTLTPDLTSYFSQVEGIICSHAGVLSHLAIMAREAGLPVIRHAHIDKNWIGTKVEITASGAVQKKDE